MDLPDLQEDNDEPSQADEGTGAHDPNYTATTTHNPNTNTNNSATTTHIPQQQSNSTFGLDFASGNVNSLTIPSHSVNRATAEDSTLQCCCGRLDCAYLKHNNVALGDLEKDLETAARLGQVRAFF